MNRNGHARNAPSALNVKNARPNAKPILITGGAGFIGTNVAHYYLEQGQRVILYDNLSRAGVEKNLSWLKQTHGNLVDLEEADVRDAARLKKAVNHASKIFHFAAQVAVTTSLVSPIEDFEINARGTLNLLEAIRAMHTPPPLLFTSTNKVYGDLSDIEIRRRATRYELADQTLGQHGISEKRSVNFHSPYGCSKGAADQYVLDYARTFDLPALVFRMSCIYGQHQFGNEDQGWVAHFLIRALRDEPITIYGDGRQVRDILFVEDLVNAFATAQEQIETVAGQAFNIGGGPRHTTSLLELMELIGQLRGKKPEVQFDEWRPADQQYYVSDTRKFSAITGWKQRVTVSEGVRSLYEWLLETNNPEPVVLIENGANSRQASGLMQGSDAPRSKRLWAETLKTRKAA
ncbi:MAG: SDR family NAD(P)-dependent oxidoreductase [Verrucomicrobiota bacterium]|nr:SDR family NAD(P)-dependent oxidoreductase [Verrucomicrobiota bacterium]